MSFVKTFAIFYHKWHSDILYVPIFSFIRMSLKQLLLTACLHNIQIVEVKWIQYTIFHSAQRLWYHLHSTRVNIYFLFSCIVKISEKTYIADKTIDASF